MNPFSEKTDVCLVQMPYAALERPSIALGLLKAALARAEIDSKVIYANISFAEWIGLGRYRLVEETIDEEVAGEWTFSGAAFPDFDPPHTAFLKRLNLRVCRGRPTEIIETLWEIRKEASHFVEETARKLVDLRPRIVGCSSSFQQHCASLALLRIIRGLDPEIVTVLGGANCEGRMGWATKTFFPWVDFVVSGEADKLISDFCRLAFEYGRDIPCTELPYGVIGPSSRLGASEDGPPRAMVGDMNRLPPPNYEEYFTALASLEISHEIDPELVIETSRGCWWGQKHHCTFCGLNGDGINYRSKDPDRILEEFEALSSLYGIRRFEVVDNILNMAHFRSVLPSLAALEKPYAIFYESHPNLRRDQVQLLSRAGVRWVQPGIENMHDELLALLNKGNTTFTNIQMLKYAREFGTCLSWNILWGIPGEKDEWYLEMVKWLPTIFHLQPPVHLIRVRFDRFSPYFNEPDAFGISIEPSSFYEHVYPLSREELGELAYFFQDEQDEWGIPRSSRNIMTPGIRALDSVVARWKQAFGKGSPVILSVRDDGEHLRFVDTRPCAVERRFHLEGAARLVYRRCDRPVTTGSLLRSLGRQTGREFSLSELEQILEEMLRLGILLHQDGKYLNLAIEGSGEPLLNWQDFS